MQLKTTRTLGGDVKTLFIIPTVENWENVTLIMLLLHKAIQVVMIV